MTKAKYKSIRETNDYRPEDFEKGVCGVEHQDFSIFLYNYPMSFIVRVSIVVNKELNANSLKVDRKNYSINLPKSDGFLFTDALSVYDQECYKVGKCLGLLGQK